MDELGLASFSDLHRFSVSERERFWILVLDRLRVVFRREPDSILDVTRGVRDPVWLSGARLNIVESCFGADPGSTAIVYGNESGRLERTSYGKLATDVRRFAAGLRRDGFRPGDAIALYLPMTPECVVAYLGTLWAGCRVVSIAESFSTDRRRPRRGHGLELSPRRPRARTLPQGARGGSRTRGGAPRHRRRFEEARRV
jgi:acetyl-CoA synthetase